MVSKDTDTDLLFHEWYKYYYEAYLILEIESLEDE
jgi:hypothetical protein